MEEVNNVAPEEKKEAAPEQAATAPEDKSSLFKEKDNWRKKAQALETELAQMKEKEMKEKNQYKELYEFQKQEAEKLKMQWQEMEVKQVESTKLLEIKKSFDKLGIKQGKMEVALELASKNLSMVKYDSDSRIVLGAEEVAKQVKEKIPEIFGTETRIPDQRAPDSNFVRNDYESWMKKNVREKTTAQGLKAGYEALGVKL